MQTARHKYKRDVSLVRDMAIGLVPSPRDTKFQSSLFTVRIFLFLLTLITGGLAWASSYFWYKILATGMGDYPHVLIAGWAVSVLISLLTGAIDGRAVDQNIDRFDKNRAHRVTDKTVAFSYLILLLVTMIFETGPNGYGWQWREASASIEVLGGEEALVRPQLAPFLEDWKETQSGFDQLEVGSPAYREKMREGNRAFYDALDVYDKATSKQEEHENVPIWNFLGFSLFFWFIRLVIYVPYHRGINVCTDWFEANPKWLQKKRIALNDEGDDKPETNFGERDNGTTTGTGDRRFQMEDYE